jgi:hypothetical protein
MSTAFALSNPRPGVSCAEPILLPTRVAGEPYFLGYARLAGDEPDGLILSNAAPVSRPFRVYHRPTGALVAQGMSASDGTWEAPGISKDEDFDVIFMATAVGERDVLVPKVRAT